MKHLSEEELIEHYYEESDRGGVAARHLKACAACAKSLAQLRRDLESVKPLTPPTRGEDYGDQVWQSIRGPLPVYESPRRAWRLAQLWKPLTLAATCALLIVSAFFAGRQWQRKQTPAVAVIPAAHGITDPQARQRVVIVVLGDHLDRSERLLVELNHADDAAAAAPLQSEARELLATNRLVRQSAGQAGDPQIEASLEHLERLLVELANEPDGLNEADLKRLREEMNTDGLLFDIRVLRSRVMEREQSAAGGTKGATI